uniref:Pectinesterase inhibitor n=1 Tax=Litchi chinensis TaxID=151069 RepID=A0A248XBI0_LITCN|nr:Pectinesterase inhibitor [Litchi chinensis]
MMFMVLFIESQVSADLIDDTCNKTPFYNLCVTTLRSDPQSSKADVQGLARIAAIKLQDKATSTKNQINDLLKGKTDPKLKGALNICADAYNIIVKYDISVIIGAITKGNPKFAEEYAIDLTKEADKCGKGISGSPLASNNKFVHDLSDVVLFIVRLLL